MDPWVIPGRCPKLAREGLSCSKRYIDKLSPEIVSIVFLGRDASNLIENIETCKRLVSFARHIPDNSSHSY